MVNLRITESIVGAPAPQLERAEIDRAERKPTESLDAYDYFLRGMARSRTLPLHVRACSGERMSLSFMSARFAPHMASQGRHIRGRAAKAPRPACRSGAFGPAPSPERRPPPQADGLACMHSIATGLTA
jgi:hypothetical protein